MITHTHSSLFFSQLHNLYLLCFMNIVSFWLQWMYNQLANLDWFLLFYLLHTHTYERSFLPNNLGSWTFTKIIPISPSSAGLLFVLIYDIGRNREAATYCLSKDDKMLNDLTFHIVTKIVNRVLLLSENLVIMIRCQFAHNHDMHV